MTYLNSMYWVYKVILICFLPMDVEILDHTKIQVSFSSQNDYNN